MDVSLGWSSFQSSSHNTAQGKRNNNKSPNKLITTSALSLSFDDINNLERPGDASTAATSTRRDALQKTLTTALLVGAPFGVPASAHADVTNKVASTTALRSLTRAQEKLPERLLPEAKANNFEGVKLRLREPPFDTLRKNGQILVRGGEDGPKVGQLVKGYKELIAALEKIDGTASLGMRGRKMDPFQLTTEYEAIVRALDSFVKVGAEAAEIPLQEAPSMAENLSTGSLETRVIKAED